MGRICCSQGEHDLGYGQARPQQDILLHNGELFCYFLHLIDPLIDTFLLETFSANWGAYWAPFYAEGWEMRSISSLAAAAPALGGETGGWVENDALSLVRHNCLFPAQLWLSLIPTIPSNKTTTP